jgi:diguanylate cyclase (GGDEF)-like protein/PAS domain S-box-containing protein
MVDHCRVRWRRDLRAEDTTPSVGSPWWCLYLVFVAGLSVAYFLVPASTAKLVLWPAIGWSAVVAMAVGVRWHRPDAVRAWYLLVAGVIVFIVGDNLYSLRHYVQHAKDLFPSYVDVVYLAIYPLLIVGLTLLVRRRTPGRDRASVVDAAIVTCGLGLVSWMVLVVPYVRTGGLSLVERLTSIAYPLGDVALLAIAARLAVGSGRRPVAFWLLTGSIVPLLVADGLYGYMNLAGTWHEHNPVDVLWIAFYAGWGAAALHPSMRALSAPATVASRVSVRRLVLVGSAALVPPAALFVEQAVGSVVDGVAIAITGAVLFVLVLSRTAGLAREVADGQSETRFRSLVNNASDAILVVDRAGRIRYQTPSAARVLHRPAADLIDQPMSVLLGEDDWEQLRAFLSTTGVTTSAEWRVAGGDGGVRDMEVIAEDLRGEAGVDGFVLTMRDITERKAHDVELRQQALHDGLTGLPNRSLFHDRVSHALNRAAHDRGQIAVLYLDLDDFKLVNDSLGHPAGDELLIAVATRLVSTIKAGDTVARLGGDEFGLLLEDGDEVAAEAVAERVLRALREPFAVGIDTLPVRASIGIAVGRFGTDGANRLLRNADLAMYMAKRNGKGHYERFTPALHEDSLRRFHVASELQGAIDNGELILHYQPIVSLPTGRMVGAEALVRWNHPLQGLLPPSEFVPIAETTGLVVPMGRWVLEEACRQVSQWRRAGVCDEDFYLSVNLSARHFHDRTVVDDVVHALDQARLPATALLIEITESAIMSDLDPGRMLVQELKALGVRMAIDDFGTGYSSLARLTTFPIDVVKIDKSFVDRLTVDAGAEAMVRSVVALCHTLGMRAVAEGVEEPEQAAALLRVGCTLAQGFLFDRPLPAVALTSALRRQVLTLAAH